MAKVICAKVVALHWEERDTAVQNGTLEVRHANGDGQYFVVSIK